jgi:recombination protein RecT
MTAAAPATVEAGATIRHVLDHYKPVIAKLLGPAGVSEETFVAQVANAMRQTPKLWECAPETVLGAALRCAQVNLPPNDGQNLAWIIPYGKVATFQLGYGGVMELARRASPGLMFDGKAVRPGDLFDVDYGRPQQVVHRPAVARSETTRRKHEGSAAAFAWWVRARYPDGREQVQVLDRAGVEYHRAHSRQPDGEMWTKNYDAAALKSCVMDMRRWLPQSPTLTVAAAADGTALDVRELDEERPELPTPTYEAQESPEPAETQEA